MIMAVMTVAEGNIAVNDIWFRLKQTFERVRGQVLFLADALVVIFPL